MTQTARTRDQQIQHVKGQLQAVELDIRQAYVNDDIAGIAIAEQRRDELLEELYRWLTGQVPTPRPPAD